MGKCCSKCSCKYNFDSVAYQKLSRTAKFKEWCDKFDALQLSMKEIKQLHKVFTKADMDGGGTIGLVELLTIIDVERTPWTKRVFSIFDDDGSGEIDFGEFVLALWNYCTLSKVSLAMFAFDLFDTDASGVLESYDLENMLKEVYGKEAATSHNARSVLKDLKEFCANTEVNLDNFLEFSRTHHSLLWPAFQMQMYLQQKMLGERFWATHAERRVKISKNKYVKIKDLIAMNLQHKQTGFMDAMTLTVKAKIAMDNIGIKADRRKSKINDAIVGEGGLMIDPKEKEKAEVRQVKKEKIMTEYLTNQNMIGNSNKRRSSLTQDESESASDFSGISNKSDSSAKGFQGRRKSVESNKIAVLSSVAEDPHTNKLYDLEHDHDAEEDVKEFMPKTKNKPRRSFDNSTTPAASQKDAKLNPSHKEERHAHPQRRSFDNGPAPTPSQKEEHKAPHGSNNRNQRRSFDNSAKPEIFTEKDGMPAHHHGRRKTNANVEYDPIAQLYPDLMTNIDDSEPQNAPIKHSPPPIHASEPKPAVAFPASEKNPNRRAGRRGSV